MLIVLLVAAAATIAGIVRGGSLEALSQTKLRWPLLLVGGLLLQTAFALWDPVWLTGPRALLVALVAGLTLLLFIAVNRHMPGMLIADLGVALNLLVIAANGAMPVSPAAADTARIEQAVDAATFGYEETTKDTNLPWLGDVIPVPYLKEVWSAGDLLLAAGIAWLVYARTVSGRPSAPHSARHATRVSG